MAKFEDKFNAEMHKRYENWKSRNILEREKYNGIPQMLKDANEKTKKSSTEYYYSSRYDVLTAAAMERLITKLPDSDPQSFKVFVFLEELFGVLDKAHKDTGHGGRDRLLKRVGEGYANVYRDVITEEEVTVREAANKQSMSGGHGYLRCSCTTKCVSKRCKCRRMGHLCNSRCHGSNPCENK